MGKNMYINNVENEFKDSNPSCLGGFIHNIDYRYWRHNVKRMLSHKRNQGRRAKGYESLKARELCHGSGKQELLLRREEKRFTVDWSKKVSAITKKRSLKARIKAVAAEQSPKEGNGRKLCSKFSSRSQLQRTYSIHHRELQDHCLGEICRDRKHPIIFFPGTNGTGANKHGDPTNTDGAGNTDACNEKFNMLGNKDASKQKIKEHTDVQQMFNVNEELFLEILQNADDSIWKSSCTLPPSKAKARFTKSRSFPVADLSPRRKLEPSKLKHKQTEIWSGPRGEKCPAGTTRMPMDVLKYTKNILSKPVPSVYSKKGTLLGRALSLILRSTIELDKEGHEELSMPCKESNQAAQFEVIEDGKEANSSSFSVHGEIPKRNNYSAMTLDSPERRLGSTINGDGAKSSCTSRQTDEYDSSKSRVFHRRSSSLNESLDKYVGLFENNYGKEAKLQSSKSLRLRNENEMGSGRNASILFTRTCSVSHLELYSSLQHLAHRYANFADWPISDIMETSSSTEDDCQVQLKPVGFSMSKKECIEQDDIEESGNQSAIVEKIDSIRSIHNAARSRDTISGECSTRMGYLAKEIDEFIVGRSISSGKQESNHSATSLSELPEPCPVFASEIFQDEVSTFEEFHSAEGLENKSDDFDEATSPNWKNTIEIISSASRSSKPNLGSIVNQDHIQGQGNILSYKKDDGDLDYVSDLLECSGFAKDAVNWTWHSLDQPLGPSIFEEMEAYWHQEFEFSSDDSSICYHHQLLFDLVNEELVHVHDRSSTHYPKALSSICRIRPFPTAIHIVKEICSRISTLMSLKPDQMQSLDSLVDLDLRNGDYWMNLQLDSECVAIETEDMIVCELLDEVLCS